MEDVGPGAVGSRQHVVVRAGGTRYALPTRCVRRVIRAPELWPVPGAEPQLLGLIQYGGEPLAVLDLAILAATEGGTVSGREVVLVLSLGNELTVGLAVEDAEQVVGLGGPGDGEGGRAELPGGGRPDIQVLDIEGLFEADCRTGG